MNDLRAYYEERLRQKKILSVVPMNVSSNLDVGRTLGYIGQQSEYDNEWKISKAIYNGLASAGRGVLGAASAAVAENVAIHQRQDPNYKPYGNYANEIAEGLESAARSDMLTPYAVRGNNFAEQVILDIAQGAGQLAGQVGATLLTGGIGGGVLMGAQIAGNQYLDLRDKGVDVERAAQAGLYNAMFQAPLEQLGVGKILGKTPAGTVLREKLRQIRNSAITEGLTEALQKYPEVLTNLYAENEGKTTDELLEMFKKDFGKITLEAGYEGIIGGILGAGGSGANLVFNERANKEIKKAVLTNNLENQQKRIEDIQKSGVNPKYAAVTINNNMPDSYVYVDGETLFQYASEKGIEKTTEALGLTVAEITNASNDGSVVEIKQGTFEAACASDMTLFQTVKEHISYSEDGYSLANLEEQTAMSKETVLSDEAKAEFDTTMADIRKSMDTALIPKAQADELEILLTARAMSYNPENPAQWFKDHPLEFTRNGIVGDGYNQIAYHGSLSSFDKFNSKFIGTGVGAQMHGWGLYFAESKDTAEDYRQRQADRENLGTVYEVDIPDNDVLIDENLTLKEQPEKVQKAIKEIFKGRHTFVVDDFIDETRYILKNIEKQFEENGFYGDDVSDYLRDEYNELVNAIINGNKEDIEAAKSLFATVVNMQLEIQNSDIETGEDFQDSSVVEKLTNDILDNVYNNIVKDVEKRLSENELEDLTGEAIYNILSGDLGSEKQASLELNKYGIKGIVFGEAGNRAYVVFDDNATNILNKQIYYQNAIDKSSLYNIQLTGNEFGEYSNISELRKKAVKWYRDNLQGTTVYNEALGNIRINKGFKINDTLFSKVGRDKMQGFSADNKKLFAAKFLKDLITNSNYVTESVSKKAKHAGEHFYYLHNTAIYGDKEYYCVVWVLQTLGNDLVYYDHRIFTDEEYTEWQKKIEDNYQEARGIGQTTADQNPHEVSSFNQIITDSTNNYKQKVFYDGRKPKGQIDFDSGKSIINLFDKADASTVIHETGHYFVEALAQDVALGRANEQAVKDWNALLEYCGITQAEWDKGGETRVKAHERLAEGFETYLMEGKAPSPKLRKVFAKFAKWLKAVYRKIRRSDNAVDLTDEVREVFDRMLASDEMIAEQARINGIFAKLPKVVTDNLSEKQNAFLMSMIEKARETATTLLVKDSLRNFSQERREEIAKYREANEASVKELLMNNPLYAASDSLENYLGTKQKAKTIARKYQNAEGKVYADWQAELKAVQADIADRLNPIVEELESGSGKGVSIIHYGDDMSLRGYRVSNNAPWYQEWFKEHHRKPSKKQYRELAYGVYTGTNDVLGHWNTAGYKLSEAEYAEMEAEQQQLKAEIDELLARETELQEQKESVKPYSHKGLNAEQRENFDVIAETFGFASGDDLAKQILEKPTFNEAVNAYLDNMVQQKYPDIYKERRLAEKAAKEDLYNEDMGAVIGLELELVNEAMEEADARQKAEALKALNKQAKAEARKRTNEELGKLAKARNQQAKAAAQYALARMSIRDAIRVDKYINAERKCAVKAAEAMAKKDFARAQGYKQQQLYNHACVREAMRLRKRFEQHQKYLHKQSKAKRDTWYREEFFNQAGALFARMGITLKGYDATMNTQTLQEFVDWANAEYDNADIAEWIVRGTVDISTPKNLTFSEYEDVVNAFKNIKAIARLAKGQNAFNSQKEFEEWKAEALENLGKLKTKWKADVNKTSEITFAEKYLRMLTNADAFFEKMDNDQTGFFTKWIYETAKMAQDKEAEMVMRYEQRKREAYKEWLPNDEAKKEAGKMHRYEELGGTEVNKHNLINMLIYLTTKSSSDKLCSTAQTSTYFLHFRNSSLWVEGDVEATRENILEFLSMHLTEADIEYAQAKVDAANMFWAELEALEKRTKGFRPIKEEAYPATLIINGKEVTFIGGYIPLVRDRQAGSRPKSQEAIRGLEDDKPGANIRTLHTNTGSTKARDASVYPLDLTEGFEDGAVMDTIHDICFRELMSDYRRMFNDAEMYQTLKEKLGQADLQSLEEYARSVAQPYSVGKPTSIAGIDMGKAFAYIRRKTVYFTIMGKFSTVFQNVGNILLYGNNVEGFTIKDSFIAMANWRKQVGDNGKGFKAMREFVTEKSVFMRERMEIPDISLRQIRDEKAKPNIVEQKAVEFGTKMLVYTDNITALPVWIHAYNKQLQAGMSEQEAINFADTVIRRTLGSSRKSDVAPMFRDDSLKLFTVFQSFFNTQFNQWAREFRLDSKLIKNGEYTEAAKNIAAFAGAKFIAANMLSLAITLTNPFADDDEDDYMNITKSLMTYPLQMAGPAGTIATVALENAIGMKNYGYRITPAQSAFDTVIRTSKQAYKYATGKGEFEDLAEASSNMFGMFYGIPQQFSILFWNGYDIFVNDMDLQGSDIFRRRPVKER